jgi:EAL domain-containing protein (putative c-di-GMP-specific phosphodiesterase class I)/ActR/RegA family two-component response regulator
VVEPPEASRGLVLIVDDEAAIRFGVSDALSYAGYEVEAVGDGEEALQRIAARRFEAVLSDISMPGMNGVELLRRVRQLDFDLPVILLTGDPRLETAIQAVDAGALRYLQKPVSIAEIEGALETAVRLCRLARWKRDSLAYLGEQRLVADPHALEWALDEALKGLFLAAQPIVRAADGSLFGRELLLRSITPQLPDPPSVLEAAERLGRVKDVGRIVRRLAANVAIPSGTCLFINVHSLELEDEELPSGQGPLVGCAKDVVLEVTERGRIDSVSDLTRRVSRLRRLGYRIAVDDFGAGYAALNSFASLRPDIAKLDMALVRNVDTDSYRRRLITSVTSMCRDLGILVVAEGIETEAEKTTLIDLGCDLLQGFLIGAPERVSN